MTEDSPTIIRLDDVSFTYADAVEPALDHVSLEIPEGGFVGVIGPSGAGKSTLAALLSGAIPHHYRGTLFGSTLVDGRDTCEVTLTDIPRGGQRGPGHRLPDGRLRRGGRDALRP